MTRETTMICCGAAAVMLLAGCATKTEIFDPNDTTRNTTRSLQTVSQAECQDAARTAAMDAMSSPAFNNFLAEYKAANGNRVPLMQVSDYLRNDTDDPSLNMRLVTDVLTKTMRDSGKVRITLATGRDASGTMADQRELSRDSNFNQKTVAKRGTLNAPRLSLEGAIISNTVRDGGTAVKVTSFNLKIADIETGEEVWSYNKPLGFKKSQTMFGL